MAIRTRDLTKAWTTTVPLNALAGGQVAQAHRVHTTHVQVDNLLGNGRNIAARVGLHGSSAFSVLNGVDPDDFTQLYPLRSTSRTAARVPPFALLPGHFLKVSALVQPSGLTVRPGIEEGDNYIDDGAFGAIDITITWTGTSGIVVTSHAMALPISAEVWGSEDGAPSSAWARMRRVETELLFPAEATSSAADLRDWSEGVTASVMIAYRGGARVVDVVLQQLPFGYARSIGTDAIYSSALVTDDIGKTVQAYPVAYPVEERSATDPTYGTALLADVAHRQQTALGPVLLHWTAWDDASTSPATSTLAPSVTTTVSDDFVDMLNAAVGWDDERAGWSLSSAAQAQQFMSSNGLRETRGDNACVPVRCWAYARNSTSGTGAIRFTSERYAVAEMAVVSTTPVWLSCTGHLRAGAHAQDQSVVQLLGKAPEGATLHIYAILIEYLNL